MEQNFVGDWGPGIVVDVEVSCCHIGSTPQPRMQSWQMKVGRLALPPRTFLKCNGDG